MKRPALIAFAFFLAGTASAQDDAPYLSSARQPVRLSAGVVFQQYEDAGRQLSQTSIPLSVTAPLGRNFGLSLLASQASATGDDVTDLSGVSDVQLGLSYFRRIGEGSVVASLGLNLPSGKRELTVDEFTTSVLLGRPFFDFRLPGFGQGFNVSPGLIYAFPAGEGVALGLGAAYNYKGPYKPLGGMPEDYDPGDEIVVTGGLDVRVGAVSNLSAEVTYTHYLADKLGDAEIFTAGGKIAATGQLVHNLGPHQLRIVARARSTAKSTLPATLGATDEDLRTLPGFVWGEVRFRYQLAPALALGLLGRARLFGETDFGGQELRLDAFDLGASRSLFDLGLAPHVTLSENLQLSSRFVYTLGDLTGFEAGGGLIVEL